jgi:hypothetical protein
MRRLTIFVLILVGCVLVYGVPAVLVGVRKADVPDVHALDCFAQARQGQIIDPRERWTVEEAQEQWQVERAQGRMIPGCWAVKPYRCDEGCQ